MPLVFLVIVIVYVFAWASDYNKNHGKTEVYKAAKFRKTNASLETELTCRYANEEGMSFEEAREKAIEEISRLGYEPCMHDSDFYLPDDCLFFKVEPNQNIAKRDSEVVRMRKSYLERTNQELTDENIYNCLPQTEYAYKWEAEKTIRAIGRFNVGDLVFVPGHKTCRIIARTGTGGEKYGYYTIRPLDGGETFTVAYTNKCIRKI